MLFQHTDFEGLYTIELEKRQDERGFFARSWCAGEFAEHGLVSSFVQCSISYNKEKGTLRGMHYQKKPCEEAKLVRCTRGSMFDVVIDLRPNSSTYCKYFSIELSSSNYKMLYIPVGFAHGFQTLEHHTEIFYQMSEFFHPEFSDGVRWNDPLFSIKWPSDDIIISEKDKAYPDYVKEGK